jgi:transcription antitermination factor NusG
MQTELYDPSFVDETRVFDSGWYAVVTIPRHEKRVVQHFQAREIEHCLPLYQAHRRWRDGSRVTLDLPLFPGYVFVRVRKPEYGKALRVPGVLRFVIGANAEPASLSHAEVHLLQTELDRRGAEPFHLLAVGTRARIRSGSLAGMEGVVLRWKNRMRVVLTLDLIRKSVAVEVDESDLEPSSPQFAA